MASSSSCFGQAFRPADHFVTSAVLAVVVVFSIASAENSWVQEALVLIWNHTFMTQFYVWNLVSSSFVETSFIKLLLSLVGIVGMGPAAEENLGHLGFAVFLLFVAVASGVVASFGIFFAYVVTRLEYLLLVDLEIHGTFGILAALGVAIAQHEPGEPLLPGRATAWFPKRYFPIVLVVLSAVCRVLADPGAAADFPFVVVGGFAAWVHLRFLAHIVHGGPVGDVNDEFQLVMFFPPVLHRFLKPVCDFTYGVFLLLGFFKGRAARLPRSAVDGEGGVDPSFATILPTPERKDPIAERRRARAMKLLDEKFAKLNAKPLHRWDDEDEGAADNGGDAESGRIGIAASSLSQMEGGAVARLGDDDDNDWGMGGGDATENLSNGASSAADR